MNKSATCLNCTKCKFDGEYGYCKEEHEPTLYMEHELQATWCTAWECVESEVIEGEKEVNENEARIKDLGVDIIEESQLLVKMLRELCHVMCQNCSQCPLKDVPDCNSIQSIARWGKTNSEGDN